MKIITILTCLTIVFGYKTNTKLEENDSTLKKKYKLNIDKDKVLKKLKEKKDIAPNNAAVDDNMNKTNKQFIRKLSSNKSIKIPNTHKYETMKNDILNDLKTITHKKNVLSSINEKKTKTTIFTSKYQTISDAISPVESKGKFHIKAKSILNKI